MGVLMAEAAYIVYRYLPAEFDEWVSGWCLLAVTVGAFGLTVLGWRHEKAMRRLTPWLWHAAWWIGIPASLVATVATHYVRNSSYYTNRLNNRSINAAVDQLKLEHPQQVFIRYNDIIGPSAYLQPELRTEVGEDYRAAFPTTINAPALLVPCADGRTIVVFPDVEFVVLARNGKPLDRYNYPPAVARWRALLQEPDGVRIETTPDGLRLETTFHAGWADGPFKAYGPDGKLLAEATYARGHLVGPCWHYRSDGTRFDETHEGP